MLKNNRNYKISSLIILSIFFDQLSKFWIRSNIESYNEIELIGSFFTLIRVENSGAFLGMGSELSYIPKLILLIIFPILVLVAVSIYTYVDKKLDNLSLAFGYYTASTSANDWWSLGNTAYHVLEAGGEMLDGIECNASVDGCDFNYDINSTGDARTNAFYTTAQYKFNDDFTLDAGVRFENQTA